MELRGVVVVVVVWEVEWCWRWQHNLQAWGEPLIEATKTATKCDEKTAI